MITHPYVTVEQWNAYLCATGKEPVAKDSTMPVLNISAIEADGYCAWAGGRLPTDAELDGQFCPVWEWTSTMDREFRVLRGGSWFYLPENCRASFRNWYQPDFRIVNFGFRCVREEGK